MNTQSGAFSATPVARNGSAKPAMHTATRPIAIEVCRTALRWCAEHRRIYAHAWRNTMAAMSVYEGIARQPAAKVQTDAAQKTLGALTRE